MLKLKASFAKKVPAETEYSSQSYHCEVECEVPDGLTAQQLNDKVHNVYQFVRNAVENELSGTNQNVLQQPSVQQMQVVPQQVQQQQPVQQGRVVYNQTQPQSGDRKSHGRPASSKQINYLLSLAQRAGWTIQQILQRCKVASVEQIPGRLCSQLIEEFSGAAA